MIGEVATEIPGVPLFEKQMVSRGVSTKIGPACT